METEEEQVERLKAWLKENGLSIVLGIVIGVGGIGGYNYWMHVQETTAAEASGHYTQMLEASAAQEPLAYVARTRLAAVQIQTEQYDQAITTLAVDFPEQFSALVDELRGDALASQGKTAEAVAAYRKAQNAEPQPANLEFLRQKLNDLGSRS